MKKWCLFCVFLLFALLSLGSAQQEMPLPPPDADQPFTIIEEPFSNVAAPPISPHWQARRSWYYTGMVAGNFDGDAYTEIAFDYGASGIWIYDPNAGTQWNQISTDDPHWMIAAGFGTAADDELIVLNSSNILYWWNYSGYPGVWTGITSSLVDYVYDAGNIGDGDTGHEVAVKFDTLGLYIWDYTGSGTYGGGDFHQIHAAEASYGEGMPIDLDGNGDYELIHYYASGLYYWNYASGYPATWTSINSNFFEMIDCLAMDVDGVAGDEFIGDSTVGLWKYTHGAPGTWTRINYNPILEAYPLASVLSGDNYEAYFEFTSGGLWFWNDPLDWERVNWNTPDFVLAADIAPVYAEESIGDFGTLGVWIDIGGHPSDAWNWTRINWNNPQYVIPANLDADAQMELVFDFGAIGVWSYDYGTNAWARLNWNSPESN